MIVFFAFQSLVLAAWVVASMTLVLRSGLRAVRPVPDVADPLPYLRDPESLLRRRIWLALTAALVGCAAISAAFFLTR